MAPYFALQCTHRNKNDSAGQKDLREILPTSRRERGIGVLQVLTAKQAASFYTLCWANEDIFGLFSKRQHVQSEPAAHDPEQQHRLEGQRQGGRRGRAI